MSYGASEALQRAIYARLAGDADLHAAVGGAIHDAVPEPAPPLFVALGTETVRAVRDATGGGAWHDLRVSVVTRGHGYAEAKSVGARIADLLDNADLTLARGTLIDLRFRRARARRDRATGGRRLDLWFRARTDDDNTTGAGA